MNEQTVFEDTYVKKQLEIAKDLFEEGKYPCHYRRLYGLPSASDVGKVNLKAEEVYGVGRLESSSREHVFDVIIPYPGITIPKVLEELKVPDLVESIYDPNTSRVTIIHGDDEITFTNIMPWEDFNEVVTEINKELMRKNIGIYCWKMIALPKHENRNDNSLFPTGFARISNSHISMLITGYAYEKYCSLVYCSVIGHKTEVNSIHASLIIKNPLYISTGRKNDHSYPDGKYEMISEYLKDISSQHSAFINTMALPGKWDPSDTYVFALVFNGEDNVDIALQNMFLSRLNEALDFPLLDEWAAPLFDRALDNGYIHRLETGGDCLAGVKINLSKDWKLLLREALEENAIQI